MHIERALTRLMAISAVEDKQPQDTAQFLGAYFNTVCLKKKMLAYHFLLSGVLCRGTQFLCEDFCTHCIFRKDSAYLCVYIYTHTLKQNWAYENS